MFKIFGALLIVTSTTMMMYKSSMAEYQTYLYLKDVLFVLNQIKLQTLFNDTYENIFNKINLNKTSFFKEFDFLEKHTFFNNINKNKLISAEVIQLSVDFFENLGKQNRQAEEDYINAYNKQVIQALNFSKQKYQNNKKLNLMAGISLGVIIVLLII